ncbi:MAG: hypothetical protein ACJAS4_002995 [Bacteriovoracaceae bacterium]|jgi:hypothetical protein
MKILHEAVMPCCDAYILAVLILYTKHRGKKMKIITFTLCLFSIMSAHSSENINIICDRPDITTVNQFDLVGTVQVGEDENSVSGSFSITTRRQGRDIQEVETTVQGVGSIKTFEPGTMAKDEVVHIQIVDKGADVEYISIVGGHPDSLSSQVRMGNGVTYRSKCEVK